MESEQDAFALERTHKQDYLRENVLDEGYDQQDFSEFMASKKEDALNVDNWKFYELTIVSILPRTTLRLLKNSKGFTNESISQYLRNRQLFRSNQVMTMNQVLLRCFGELQEWKNQNITKIHLRRCRKMLKFTNR